MRLYLFLLFSRVLLLVPEVVWNAVGFVWYLSGHIDCKPETIIPILMKGRIHFIDGDSSQ